MNASMMCHVQPNTRPVSVVGPEICESRSEVTQKFGRKYWLYTDDYTTQPKALALLVCPELDMHIINEVQGVAR